MCRRGEGVTTPTSGSVSEREILKQCSKVQQAEERRGATDKLSGYFSLTAYTTEVSITRRETVVRPPWHLPSSICERGFQMQSYRNKTTGMNQTIIMEAED